MKREGRADRAIDPELAALATLIPRTDLTDPAAARQLELMVAHELPASQRAQDYELVSLKRADGSELATAMHLPHESAGAREALPVLLFLHGGSFVTGGLHTELERCAFYADTVNCAVVSIDYRLAPENPFPAAFEDCRLALRWIETVSAERRFDPSRVAIGGLSAGAGLAAAVAYSRASRSGMEALAAHSLDPDPSPSNLRIVLQVLLFPTLDAGSTSVSAREFDDTPVLDASMLPIMWRHYLGPDARASPLSSPGTATDFTGCPPAFIATAQYDPLRDEAIRHAQNLLRDGVPVDLHHYARAYHSFDSFHTTRLGRVARQHQAVALLNAFR